MNLLGGYMDADCCGHGATFKGLSADYKRRLWLVIAINATMFLVEIGAGAVAGTGVSAFAGGVEPGDRVGYSRSN